MNIRCELIKKKSSHNRHTMVGVALPVRSWLTPDMQIKTIKILLVEDNPDDVFFLHAALDRVTGTHFELEIARNLAAAVERLAAGNIDLVLLDPTLPDGA